MLLTRSVPSFLLLAVLLLTGCSDVRTTSPLSPEPKPIDQAKFEGAWLLDKSPIWIHFASTGVAQMAGIERKDDAYRLVQAEMVVTQGKHRNYLSMRAQNDKGEWEKDYILLAYRFTSQGDLLVWTPRPDAFATAVKDKALPGEVREGQHDKHVVLSAEPGKVLEFIDKPDAADLFDFENPTLLKKLSSVDAAAP